MTGRTFVRLGSAAMLVGTCIATVALAQQYVYPAKGQTPDQQKADESQCYTWAVQQTGFDPAKPPAAAAPPPPTTATGTTPGAGARGAARGAVVGEIVADDPGAGAAVGAVAARGQSRSTRSKPRTRNSVTIPGSMMRSAKAPAISTSAAARPGPRSRAMPQFTRITILVLARHRPRSPRPCRQAD